MTIRSVTGGMHPGAVIRGGRRGRHGTRRGQGGAVLLATLALTILAGGGGVLLARFDDTATVRAREAAATTRALADARRALIGWSVGAGLAGSGEAHAPGVLPFPDRNTDPYGYDGEADCVTGGLSDRHLVGRLAGAGEASPCPDRALGVELRDGSGEPLWYAVSRNLVNHRGGGASDPPINPGLLDRPPAYPWLRLIDADGRVVTASDGEPLEIAAVVIAPGPPLPRQSRTGVSPGPSHFLDSVTVNGVAYDNADADGCRDAVTGAGAHTDCPGRAGEEFILYPDSRDTATETDAFNDRIAWITAEELLRAAEARALGEMAVILERYRSRHGAYPWLAPYAGDPAPDPTGTVLYHGTADGAGGVRHGMLPVHAMPGQLYDTGYVLRWTIDAGAAVVTTDPSSIGSTPPPTDAELYALASAVPQVVARPAVCAWNGDDGVHCAGEPYRYAPGVVFTASGSLVREREVRVEHDEATWIFSGGAVAPGADPSAAAPRTRTVTVTTTLPPSFTASVRGRNREVGCADLACSTTVTTGMSVERTLTVDTGTLATFTFAGLEHDLSVAWDGVPRWFVDNGWYRYVRAAVSGEEAGAGGASPGRCIGSGSGCLALSASGVVRADVPAFLVGSGPALPHQARDGCGGACAGAYFEPPHDAAGGDTATRAALAADFNDQVRVAGPPGTSP
ncbi:MAG: hypothetical protein OXC25_05800 [Thiotrichales bacterium]|nr:hypothetical protein [Thiotrichales bacterium]